MPNQAPTLALLLSLTLPTSHLLAQPGAIDPSFNPNATPPGTKIFSEVDAEDEIIDLEVDSKGRTVVVTLSVTAGGARSTNSYDLVLSRFLPTGSIDTSFAGSGSIHIGNNAGSFAYIDPSFGGLAIGADDDIYLGFTEDGTLGGTHWSVHRYSESGISLATSTVDFDLVANGTDALKGLEYCDSGVYAVGIARDATDGDFAIARLNRTTLALDSSFNSTGKRTIPIDLGDNNEDHADVVRCFSTQHVFIAGSANTSSGSKGVLVRLTNAGALDTTFGGTGIRTYSAPSTTWPTIQADLIPIRGGGGPLGESDITIFSDLLIDLNGLLWTAGTALNSQLDTDAVVLLTDLNGVPLTNEGVNGWQGANFLDASPIFRGIPGLFTSTQDSAVKIHEASPTLRVVTVASLGYDPMSGPNFATHAFRLKYPGMAFDSSFNGDGNNDGMVQVPLPMFNSTPQASALDPHGRLMIGGTGEVFDGLNLQIENFITRLRDADLFINGFETGDLSAWDSNP